MIAAVTAHAQEPGTALSAALTNNMGATAGAVQVEKAQKGLIFTVEVTGLSPGWHAAHIHGVADCSDHAAHFQKAGGHASREGEEHGYKAAAGPHSGDLPNIWVHADGTGRAQLYVERITMAELNDADGSAFMLHGKADDHQTQPAGDSGDRIACGVIR